MMATEISVDNKNAKQQASDSIASMPPAAMMQQKMIAMVFVNDDTLGGESFSIDILKVYAIPASFIESDNDASLRVKIGSHQYVDLRGKSLQDVKISMTENHVIVLRSSEVMKDPSKLTMLIEKLQAEGYTFVNLSAMQK